MVNKSEHVVVSMTSFPAAINYAVGAIRSLLAGNALPDRLILYVTLSQFGDEGLPTELKELEKQNDIFEIRDYPVDIRSYRKLIPALSDFPDSIIVTVDDDVYYHPDMLGRLLKFHELFPDDIIAHRAKRIAIGKPYRKWRKFRWYHFINQRIKRSTLNIQTGVGGVLYPPGALCKEMMDAELFTKLAPTADDIWFWAAAVTNGRKILPVPFGFNKPKGLGKPRSLSLKTVNFKDGTDRNVETLENIMEYFPEIRRNLEYGH